MKELWQIYDEQGRPVAGKGAAKEQTFKEGLLHGASHVWIWRLAEGRPEVLLQQRSATKRTWPNMYDISAAGHIDLGEEPITAAIREAREEIGWKIGEETLSLIAVHRTLMQTDGAIENEFQWLYLLQAEKDAAFHLQSAEVSSMSWKSLDDFRTETTLTDQPTSYVPHGRPYYLLVCEAIESQEV